MRKFSELIGCLPSPNRQPKLASNNGPLTYVTAREPTFVAPTVTVTREFETNRTSVALVSSPAAVGKTTIARQIAFHTGAPLWDFSLVRVGNGTFLGTLIQAYGAAAFNQVLIGLSSGQGLVVLDALDETQLRSGNPNFEAFVVELSSFLQQPRLKPSVIVLGRTDTIELMALQFEIDSVPYSQLQIDFFDRDSSIEFICKRLDAITDLEKRARIHRNHSVAFLTVLEKLFATIFNLLGIQSEAPWDDPRVRSFLGYAPVLQAIASFVDVGNYQALSQDIDRAAEELRANKSSGPWELLFAIIYSLLDRERGKVVTPMKDTLDALAKAAKWNDWDQLYSRDEQHLRATAKAFGETGVEFNLRKIPHKLWARYDELVGPMSEQHPFLGNVNGFANAVFRDYIYAWNLVHGPPALAARVKERLTKYDHLPSSILGRFILALSSEHDEIRIRSFDFPILQESIQSQAAKAGEIQLFISSDESSPNTLKGVFLFLGPSYDEIKFQIEDCPNLEFSRRVAFAFVDTAGSVTLGNQGQELHLGPSVEIKCSEIIWSTSEVVLLTARDDASVIRCERISQPYGAPRLRKYGDGQFYAAWSPLEYPWIAYRLTDETPLAVSQELLRKFHQMCHILSWFQGGGYGGLQRYKRLIDTAVLGKSEIRKTIMAQLIKQKMIRSDGVFYVLDPERMAQLGINWADLRLRKMNDAVRQMLEEI